MPRRIDEARLFEAVLQLWVSEGFAGTTTKAIATRAGVNEATLFRRYGGKAELVVTALGARLATVPLRSATASDELEADLVHIVEAYLQTYRQVGAVFPLLLVEAARNPELRPALEVVRENIEVVVGIIAHHQARGSLREENPLTTAMALLSPLFVAGLTQAALPELPLAIDTAAHVRGFLAGRGVRGARGSARTVCVLTGSAKETR